MKSEFQIKKGHKLFHNTVGRAGLEKSNHIVRNSWGRGGTFTFFSLSERKEKESKNFSFLKKRKVKTFLS
jgi:hypothetical protein